MRPIITPAVGTAFDGHPNQSVAGPSGIALRAPLGHMQGAATKSMSPIYRGGATWQMARCRRNPQGAAVFGSQTSPFVDHDEQPSLRSSLRA